MGICQTGCIIKNQKTETVLASYKTVVTKMDSELMVEKQKNEFPDMKEWQGDRYKGIGLKKMKGYKCDLPIDKLNEKREIFWSARNNKTNKNYEIWRIINQACVYDEIRANMLLEENELTTFNGCINHIIDKKGNHYIIPNYCINDPYFEKQYVINENIKYKNMKIVVYDMVDNINTNLEVNNLINGEKLKQIFCDKLGIKMEDYKLRLFFSGSEIKNNNFLYQYNIQNGYKIQIVKLGIKEKRISDDNKTQATIKNIEDN